MAYANHHWVAIRAAVAKAAWPAARLVDEAMTTIRKALAATPTPPTLSDDLRTAIVRDLIDERKRYNEDSPTWRAFGFCIDIAEKAELARAQVKAS